MPQEQAHRKILLPQDRKPVWQIDPDYSGPVLVWDLDKTYLATNHETIWALIKTALEKPEKKQNISGVIPLLKHLRSESAQDKNPSPVFFVSASPSQMAKKITAKLKLDGIEFTGLMTKNQWENVKRGKFSKLRRHVGYKLMELIRIWYFIPKKCSIICFGDDSEGDALTYSLFADICEKKMTGRTLAYLLRDLGLDRVEALTITRWQKELPQLNPVKQIYIHLITQSDPDYYLRYGQLLLPTRNAFQIALSEYCQERMTLSGVAAVAYEMHVKDGMSTQLLRRSAEDILSRAPLIFRDSLEQKLEELWNGLSIQNLIDQKPQHAPHVSPVFKDPISHYDESLRIRMKYYEEMV